MDTLSISPTKAPAVQATVTPASSPQAKAVPSPGVAAKVREAEPAKDAADAKIDIPERDSRSLKYLVDGNRVITTIVDDKSKTVVVQIPDAELIRIAKSIDRMQGFFIERDA